MKPFLCLLFGAGLVASAQAQAHIDWFTADVGAVINDNGFTRRVTRPSPGTNRFYRLRHP